MKLIWKWQTTNKPLRKILSATFSKLKSNKKVTVISSSLWFCVCHTPITPKYNFSSSVLLSDYLSNLLAMFSLKAWSFCLSRKQIFKKGWICTKVTFLPIFQKQHLRSIGSFQARRNSQGENKDDVYGWLLRLLKSF